MLVPAVGALVVAAACRSEVTGPPDLALATERAEYAAGDTVRLTVTNRGARDAFYGCPNALGDLERQADAGWRAVAPPRPEVVDCLGALLVVRPGRSAPLSMVPLPVGLAAGTYRVRLPHLDGQASNTFRLR